LQAQLRAAVLQNCPGDKAKAVAWALLSLGQNGFANADVAKQVSTCAFDEAGKEEVIRVIELGVATYLVIEDDPTAKRLPSMIAELFFEWTKLADPDNKDRLDSLQTMFLGLVAHDWTQVVVGIGHLATATKVDMKLVRIVGAVGQFAETYTTGGKGDINPSAARAQVIEDLITSMVDRSSRDHGAVISLGGALGAFGGARFNDSGNQVALPVRLTLGLGLDTYHGRKGGLHMSLDAFDLAQYVTYSSGSLEVSSPDVKASLIVGGTLAYWFGNRETPLFFGAHGSTSPFVRTMDGKPTYEVGAIFGVYVPLLDFN
jgi:hypothetical protein